MKNIASIKSNHSLLNARKCTFPRFFDKFIYLYFDNYLTFI